VVERWWEGGKGRGLLDVGPTHRPSFLGCLGNHGILDRVLAAFVHSFKPKLARKIKRAQGIQFINCVYIMGIFYIVIFCSDLNSDSAEHEDTCKAAASRGIFREKWEGVGEGREASQ
jgi:hypothetical protein